MWSFVSTWAFSKQAAEAAAEILDKGGDALDAVIAGIHRVESDATVDSVGKGGYLNSKGELTMDAAVMDGNTLNTGAACFVRCFEHPIDIARAVMEKLPHNIMVGAGAEEFAREMGIPESKMEDLITPLAWENYRKLEEKGHDTIGAIAMDNTGKIVVGTSTSGSNRRLAGRVGDSPIIGSGFYAESGVGAAAATGWGEHIMRSCCSFRCVELMRAGMSAQEAVETTVRLAHDALAKRGEKPDCIAMVCMDKDGNTAAACNHRDFAYAHADSGVAPEVLDVVPVIDKDQDDVYVDGVLGFAR